MNQELTKSSEQVKDFYISYHDRITEKRLQSPFPIRKYAHISQYEAILKKIDPDDSVLDSGCGEGNICLLLAERGIRSTGVDLSNANIQSAQKTSRERGLDKFTTFITGDAEQLPFADKSFDVIVSSHVLEHLPDFDKGWQELCRVARKRIVVALPTCLNPCAWALLGGDHGFWQFSKKSFFAMPYGFLRVILNLYGEGVQEGYAGKNDIPHIWRYPWVVKRKLKNTQWELISYEASSFCLPYFKFLLPLVRLMDRFRLSILLRYFGYGSTLVFKPRTTGD
ncbi:MAG: class I SAM-dependent methyltransferase [Patescibacteria group bacterium]|jgi:ubiquinone/menaquinone biosynthesis C-methylase UbiE